MYEPVTITGSASDGLAAVAGVGEGLCAETEQATKANNPPTEAEM